MSLQSLENEISSATRMDLPINTKVLSKWQRKALENTGHGSSGANNSTLNVSVTSNANTKQNVSTSTSRLAASLSASASGTQKRGASESVRKTPAKTPKKSPSRFLTGSGITPGRRTPSASDRFIPSRVGTDFEKSHFLMVHREHKVADEETMSPSQREYQLQMSKKLHGSSMDDGRILQFQNKPPSALEANSNSLKNIKGASNSPSSSAKKLLFLSRQIPQVPERILDAPDIVNDYYLNLLDWSSNNLLAVGLGCNVYLWNADNAEINHLLELDGDDDYVSSVRWMPEGDILAVGNSQGEIGLWDVVKKKQIRCMTGHTDRVGSLSWNKHILSSGSRSGQIHHSDVRSPDHLVAAIAAHTAEVCGLAWSPDFRFLASGGNDNLLKIWPVAQGQCYSQSTPLYTFAQHQGAVKAVSWCPWQPGILATGGGTADKTIKIWNINSGILVNSVDAKSQVCSLLWSSEYKELVSAHGYAKNEVVIWKYPSMVKTAELLGHTDRVLHLTMSADETTVVSAGADETLRLWRCFVPDENKKKLIAKSKSAGSSILRAGIR